MLSKSAPNSFHFIEPRLLLVGPPRRRVNSADFQQRAMSPHADRSSAATAVAPTHAPLEQRGRRKEHFKVPGVRELAGCARGDPLGGGVNASRTNPWLETVRSG
jgi:hypothetical protein